MHPARIGDDMMRQAARMLERIEWSPRDVGAYLGQYLTEPKAHVIFERPARPLSERGFVQRAARAGVALDLRSQMLFRGRLFFINGERHEAAGTAARLLRGLADRRRLAPPLELDGEAARLLYPWYRAGYILLGDKA
jgi:50S ribosomal protein L16 3-hydroxylase